MYVECVYECLIVCCLATKLCVCVCVCVCVCGWVGVGGSVHEYIECVYYYVFNSILPSNQTYTDR